MSKEELQLAYTILCDDVRLEAGNKLSYMGVFQNLILEQLPASLLKFAVINRWYGFGIHETEVRILPPHSSEPIASSMPTKINLMHGGLGDNISFFVNTHFSDRGTYRIQVYADGELFAEQPLEVTDVAAMNTDGMSDVIN
jgi:hypothetical protein